MSGALVERMPEAPRSEASTRSCGFVTIDVPAGGPAAFLAAHVAGDALLWAPPAGDADGWTFAARGVAATIEASGRERYDVVRDSARALLAAVHGAAGEGAPPVRLFGGFAFHEDAGAREWEAFGDASFTLPRLVYAEREGRAWLRAFVALDAPCALESVIPELYRVRAALVRGTHVEAPAAAVRVTELPRDAWAERVGSALAAFRGPDLRKVVLARRTRVELPREIEPSGLAAALPADGTTRFLFGRGGDVFAGATPERLVSLRAGRFRCDALGGSLPRSGAPESEAAALRASAKDGREHAAVVAGIRAALAPFAGELAADGPRVRTLATVHHLHTEVTGTARERTGVLDLVETLHPTPAVCGEPREAARGWIAAHEGPARGWYAGPVGWIDEAGEGSFCVALRCALIREREALLYAGAGLVEGSEAELEWRETAAKQAPMLRALGGSP